MKGTLLGVVALMVANAAYAAETTVIRHPNGETTTISTNERGDHHAEHSSGTGGQFGSGRTHADVVKEYLGSGARVERHTGGGREKAPAGRERLDIERGGGRLGGIERGDRPGGGGGGGGRAMSRS